MGETQPRASYSLFDWYKTQQQSQQPYRSMMNWGAPVPVATPAGTQMVLPDNGADWEQMPMGTNGLGTNEGMFAGSAVNAPIKGGMGYQGVGTSQPNAMTQWLRDKGVIGSTDANGIRTDGWGGLALGAATGLGSLYLGMQQYNLAKDTLANNKAQFERQFQANKQLTNSNLEDRQRARVASNAGAYQSVGDYMAQNGIK